MKDKTLKINTMRCVIMLVILFSMIGTLFTTNMAEDVVKEEKTIGVLQFADHPSLLNTFDGLIAGLEDEGYVVGENLNVDYQVAKADMALNQQIASDMGVQNYDLVVGIATPSAQALYNAVNERGVPLVFNAVTDPIAAGLATESDDEDSLFQTIPGVTGITDRLPIEQQLRLIRKLLPEAETIGILYTNSEANSVASVKGYEDLADKYGFEIVAKSISDTADLPLATDQILQEVDVLTNITDNTVVNNMQTILYKAKQANVPYFGSEEEQVRQGLLAAAGLDYFELGVECGKMSAEILDGEEAENIDIKVKDKVQYFYNSQTLEELNLELPALIEDDGGTTPEDVDTSQDDFADLEAFAEATFFLRDVNPEVEKERGVEPNERNVTRNEYFNDEETADD